MPDDTPPWTHEAIVRQGLDPKDYEIVDGGLREIPPMSIDGSRVIAELTSKLNVFVSENDLGEVYGHQARFRLQETPRTERRPDISFLGVDRALRRPRPEIIEGGPDLVVEVVSPTDQSKEIARKARLYLARGSQEVWIVEPELCTVTVLRNDQPNHSFSPGEVLTSVLLPGFELPIDEIFV